MAPQAGGGRRGGHGLRTQAGRRGLLGWLPHHAEGRIVRAAGLARLHEQFWSQTRWWEAATDQNVSGPSYKRRPYFQRPPLARLFPAEGRQGKHPVVTTDEIIERAEAELPVGDPELVYLYELRDAERNDFIGARAELLRDEFFRMRDKVPKAKVRTDEAQVYLNTDAAGKSVYVQLGWLDSIAFGAGSETTSYAESRFVSFTTVPEVHGCDHLMTKALLAFTPSSGGTSLSPTATTSPDDDDIPLRPTRRRHSAPDVFRPPPDADEDGDQQQQTLATTCRLPVRKDPTTPETMPRFSTAQLPTMPRFSTSPPVL